MALYKGSYRDKFQGPATYTVKGTEHKTVDGISIQNYKQGLDITVDSGKLKIDATVLVDHVSGVHLDVDTDRKTMSKNFTSTIAGVNVNAYGVFFLSTGATNSLGTVVTSHGSVAWVNLNLFKMLVTVVATPLSHKYDNRSKKKKILHAIRYVRTGNEHETASKSKVS